MIRIHTGWAKKRAMNFVRRNLSMAKNRQIWHNLSCNICHHFCWKLHNCVVCVKLYNRHFIHACWRDAVTSSTRCHGFRRHIVDGQETCPVAWPRGTWVHAPLCRSWNFFSKYTIFAVLNFYVPCSVEYTACVSGFWGLCPQTPTAALPLNAPSPRHPLLSPP